MPGSKLVHISEEAFKSVFEAYKKRVYGYVLAVTHSAYTAEEITQEVFIKLWICRDSLSRIDNVDPYIFSMTHNKILNYLRKAANDTKLLSALQQSSVCESNNVEEYSLTSDYNNSVNEALRSLSSQPRIVYQLSRQQGLNFREIADTLQLSPNTVKNHLVTALRTIRSYVKNNIISTMLLVALSYF